MMNIPNNINDEIWEYCRLNKITNIDDFILKMLKQGFTVEKYGSTPNTIEKIVEIEKIIEVPIEMVDSKLTQLNKKISDENKKLKAENLKLKNSNEKTIKELEKLKNKNDLYGE